MMIMMMIIIINISAKEFEKLSKYKVLQVEVERI